MSDDGSFRALVLDEADGKVTADIHELDDDALPEGDVTVAVSHSTLNYKDGLIVNGIGRLVQQYPHVPGIDFAGTVIDSGDDRYKPGDEVLLTGWRVGETHWGGFAQRARVKADWLVPLPPRLTRERAMALGTAGFTAMLAVMALEEAGIMPETGEVLVTGANGGLGGVAIIILAGLGYTVTASTGRTETADALKALGASSVIDRGELSEGPSRPLLSSRWAGAVDAVGGTTLATVMASLTYRGAVAVCGNTGGNDLPASVLPFLLRGVRLIGIDSVLCPFKQRQEAWRRLAREVPADALDGLTHHVTLDEVPGLAVRILKGQTQGRTVIDL